jgi:replication-associated recombination protein RarA
VSEGDARKTLNILELAFLSSLESDKGQTVITLAQAKEVTQDRSIYYDEDDHYNTIWLLLKACAVQILMPRSIGWQRCLKQEKIPSS